MGSRTRVLALGMTAATLGGARAGATEAWLGNAALSYQARVDHETDYTYRAGASLSLATRVWGPLAVVGEASLNGRSIDFRSTSGGVFDMRYESIRGRIRLARWRGRLRPYGQVAAGPVRSRVRERLDPTGREGGGWGSAAYFSVAPGLGLRGASGVRPHALQRERQSLMRSAMSAARGPSSRPSRTSRSAGSARK